MPSATKSNSLASAPQIGQLSPARISSSYTQVGFGQVRPPIAITRLIRKLLAIYLAPLNDAHDIDYDVFGTYLVHTVDLG
jgi:hypothetical protein